MTSTPVYEVRDLVKTYKSGKVRANDGLSFDIQQGEIFGLLGPNGAGKSTLVGQLTGLLRPDSGVLRLYGHDISRDSKLATEVVAALTQTPLPLGDLTVREVLRVTGHLRGLTRRDARDEADRLIDLLGLGDQGDKRLGKLSGGLWRLATIAVALIGERPVLVLDEPTNELDPVNRRMIWDLLLDLKMESGRTIILVTHNVLEAERVIERVGIIDHGRVVAWGTPGELKSRVDDRVRLELTLANGREDLGTVIASLGDATRVTDQHWVVLVGREAVARVMTRVMVEIGLDRLDDFRVATPTLEDVYLRLADEPLQEDA